MTTAAEIIVDAVFIYFALGAAFGLWFAVAGVTRLDESARGTGVVFRAIVFFGAAAFWVLLLRRLIRGEQRPAEKNAHRTEAEK
ncbi:MAG: hypothetical protein JSS81_09815 [Acidobacteria bacterium]|nr:hypothetical protein [Acidobacteriota bacterium]